MFPSDEAKAISSVVETILPQLMEWVGDSHSDSLSSTVGEIPFLDALCSKYSGTSLFSLPSYLNLSVKANIKKIHQKPYVLINGVQGPELGDLLFVVSYQYNGKLISRKAVIHQVKIEKNQNASCWSINGKQLELLSSWPQFSLVSSYGGPYIISPSTKEGGSYYLLRRSKPSGPTALYARPQRGITALLGGPKPGYGVVCAAPDIGLAIDDVRATGIRMIPRPKPYQNATITLDQLSAWQHPDHKFFAEHIAHTKGELAMTGYFSELIDDVLAIPNAASDPNFFVIEVVVGANT